MPLYSMCVAIFSGCPNESCSAHPYEEPSYAVYKLEDFWNWVYKCIDVSLQYGSEFWR